MTITATVEKEILSDNSHVFYVRTKFSDDPMVIRMDTESFSYAEELAALINERVIDVSIDL